MTEEDWTSVRVRKETADRLKAMGLKNYDVAIQALLIQAGPIQEPDLLEPAAYQVTGSGPGSFPDEVEILHNWSIVPDEVGLWQCRCGARRRGLPDSPPNNIVICVAGFEPTIPDPIPKTRIMAISIITPEQFIRALRRDCFEAVGGANTWTSTEFGVIIARITHILRDPEEMVRLEAASKLAWPDGAW